MKNRWNEPLGSEITPKPIWQQRRQLLSAGALLGLGLAASTRSGSAFSATASNSPDLALNATLNSALSVTDALTPERVVTGYNNFYEFGTGKSDPARYASALQTEPWSVRVEGEVLKPKTFALEDLLKLSGLQERIYRLRCVEGWSMVIPWIGYPLSDLLKQVEPTGNAKYVEFVSDMQPEAMPGLKSRILNWPYREGLRLDEAMNPLTLLTFGLYGEVLPNQNGAPVRLVVPWKYGFKSAKSIVTIRLTEQQPVSSWEDVAPQEYGFYANVNPEVSHPRWSQARERRLGSDSVFGPPPRATLMFNGYADQVASLYSGMDLAKHY